MKRLGYVGYVLLIASLIAAFSACTIHIPSDWWGSEEFRVILNVVPDDAQVLLNGKWIGEAHEFSTWKSAIRLSSRNNELVIKKEGYVEEAIDLYQYDSEKIVISLNLLKDKDYVATPAPPKKPDEKVKPEAAEGKPPKPTEIVKKPGDVPRTEPPKEIPPEPMEEEPTGAPILVSLDIQPEESSIYLDGKFWGISPQNVKIENLRLKPGKYTLEVVKPGYLPFSKEIEVKDQELSLVIQLVKK